MVAAVETMGVLAKARDPPPLSRPTTTTPPTRPAPRLIMQARCRRSLSPPRAAVSRARPGRGPIGVRKARALLHPLVQGHADRRQVDGLDQDDARRGPAGAHGGAGVPLPVDVHVHLPLDHVDRRHRQDARPQVRLLGALGAVPARARRPARRLGRQERREGARPPARAAPGRHLAARDAAARGRVAQVVGRAHRGGRDQAARARARGQATRERERERERERASERARARARSLSLLR